MKQSHKLKLCDENTDNRDIFILPAKVHNVKRKLCETLRKKIFANITNHERACGRKRNRPTVAGHKRMNSGLFPAINATARLNPFIQAGMIEMSNAAGSGTIEFSHDFSLTSTNEFARCQPVGLSREDFLKSQTTSTGLNGRLVFRLRCVFCHPQGTFAPRWGFRYPQDGRREP